MATKSRTRIVQKRTPAKSVGDRDLLLEIGTEEIPARFFPTLLRQLETDATKMLADQHIPSAGVAVYATPCRIVLHIRDVATAAETRVIEKSGPPWDSSFDAENRPTPALLGFLKSVSAGVPHVVQVQKKDRIFAGVRIEEKGRAASQILAETLPGIIGGLRVPKSMRWRTGDATAFARPVRWIFCILHGRPLSFQAFGIRSGARTYGNKFFFPQMLRPVSAAVYFKELEKRYVIVDGNKRREKILREAKQILARRRMKSDLPEALVSEVSYLTEYPTVLLGDFSPEFLRTPDVVLRCAMMHHQRYFPVSSSSGAMAPHFLVVRNGPADRRGVVAHGNARVLTARISDAQYFFETDRKKKLAERVDGLKGIVYMDKLGTMHDRARRIRGLMVMLPPRIGIEIDLERYADAAYLCKADLVTDVVREFPELQGVMGRIYAGMDGVPVEIADAISEHYQPRGPHDPLPESPLGSLLALADKLELIIGAYSIGIRPSASADPYGLRRAAIGVCRILLARAWHLELGAFIDAASQAFDSPDTVKAARGEILEFLRGRLEAILKESSPAEFISACMQATDDPCAVAGKVAAFVRVSAEGKTKWVTLLRTAKRAYNIIKTEKNIQPLNELGFQQDEERDLFRAFQQWQTGIRGLPPRKYTDRLRAILQMAEPMNRFFEKVFVMVEDPVLRQNRLALIRTISDAFRSYADFDKIAVND